MKTYKVTQTRTFLVGADSEDEALGMFWNAFDRFKEGEFEHETSLEEVEEYVL